MAELKFDMTGVRKLYDHALAAKEQQLTFGMLADPALLKDGEVMPARGYADEKQIDRSKVKPHLLLVKDQGCYLISGGLPGLPDPARVTPSNPDAQYVVYARGLGPDADWDLLRDVCGGDDFAETINIEFVGKALAAGATELVVEFDEDRIGLSYTASPEPKAPSAEELARIALESPDLRRRVEAIRKLDPALDLHADALVRIATGQVPVETPIPWGAAAVRQAAIEGLDPRLHADVLRSLIASDPSSGVRTCAQRHLGTALPVQQEAHDLVPGM